MGRHTRLEGSQTKHARQPVSARRAHPAAMETARNIMAGDKTYTELRVEPDGSILIR